MSTICVISHPTFHRTDYISYSPGWGRGTVYFGNHDFSWGIRACMTLGSCNRKALAGAGGGGRCPRVREQALGTFSEVLLHEVSRSLWEHLKHFVHLAASMGLQRRTSWKGLWKLPPLCPQPGMWCSFYLQLGVCIIARLWEKARTQQLTDRSPRDLWWVDLVSLTPSLPCFSFSTSNCICLLGCVRESNGMKDGTVLRTVPGTKQTISDQSASGL